MAYIQAENGPDTGRRFELSRSTLVMGRLPDCDVVIDAGAVSRRHAQVVPVGGSYFVEDLGSRNGTFLNDRRIEGRRRLAEGDRVRVCDVTFTFFAAEPVHAAAVKASDGSGFSPVLVDDPPRAAGSTIMSTLDVSGSSGAVRIRSSAVAKLAAMMEITQRLGKSLSLDTVLPNVLDSLFKIFVQADRGFIVLRGEGGKLTPRWTKIRRDQSGESLRISRTIIRQVIDSREAILSADAANDERFEMSQSIAEFRIRSMMCAPLIDSSGKAFGALQIDTLDQRHRFASEDLEVLASVASQAAIAIDNAQLHEHALRQQAIERDLVLANRVQRGFLPKGPPEVAGYCFFDYYQPANRVGGDYYDYVDLAAGRMAVVVADVVGHGVAAALLMARLSAEVRFCLAREAQPGKALSRLNDALCRDRLEDRFVTLVMAVLDPATHEVAVANAGHMPPMWRRGETDVLDVGESEAGMPLGLDSPIRYGQASICLAPGQLLTLYTDGVNEAMNARGELYGIARLRRRVAAGGDAVEALGRKLMTDVAEFVGDQPQHDDMCLVCFGRREED